MSDHIHQNLNNDGVDRRGFLSCMAWAGTGLVFTLSGGIARSRMLLAPASDQGGGAAGADFTFVQISDSHIGFNKDANNNVIGTLQEAIGRIKALPAKPDLIIHTGDLTHLAEADEFDTVDQALKGTGVSDIFYVPGEHDILNDNGEQYRNRFAKGTSGDGWYSFTHRGVHFVFAHVPLWEVYPQWGWGTTDGATALGFLKRFGSVSVLNGHIHQVVQKVEGNITFHTAMSTAFPQPAPGTAPKGGPMKVPADQLKKVLGITTVNYVETPHSLAIIDKPLVS
jgi:Icc protein